MSIEVETPITESNSLFQAYYVFYLSFAFSFLFFPTFSVFVLSLSFTSIYITFLLTLLKIFQFYWHYFLYFHKYVQLLYLHTCDVSQTEDNRNYFKSLRCVFTLLSEQINNVLGFFLEVFLLCSPNK